MPFWLVDSLLTPSAVRAVQQVARSQHDRGRGRAGRLLDGSVQVKAAAIIAALLCTAAHAEGLKPVALGLHIGSRHFEARDSGTWNDNNPGVYARWSNGLVVGTLRNSERRQSVYVGKVFETPRWHGLGADVTVGGITGYARDVSPLLALSGSLKFGQAAARLSYLPKAHPAASAAVHFSTEWSF